MYTLSYMHTYMLIYIHACIHSHPQSLIFRTKYAQKLADQAPNQSEQPQLQQLPVESESLQQTDLAPNSLQQATLAPYPSTPSQLSVQSESPQQDHLAPNSPQHAGLAVSSVQQQDEMAPKDPDQQILAGNSGSSESTNETNAMIRQV
jgi:hypothetical protein